ncbi:MAG: hypothetical protein JKY09_08080 [Crocinitomicaceae bacterium]|nr:hypothetical protein [Crocinitomicaceae bacterium]
MKSNVIMKSQILLSFIFICFSSISQGYNLSYFTDTYNDLSNSTSLNNGNTWDDPDYTIPIGFNFDMYGNSNSQIYLDGSWFGATLATDLCAPGFELSFLMPDAADIVDRGYDIGTSMSNISYKLEGPNGNRILKIEWNNVGFLDGNLDAGNVYIDFTNFQVWLYEIDNAIEYRYGPNSISDPLPVYGGESGTWLGILPEYSCDIGDWLGNVYSLEGDPLNPSMSMFDPNLGNPSFLNDVIPSGMVYRFTPSALGFTELNNSNKQLIKIVDYLGRETEFKPNTPLIYIYTDGSTERVFEMRD